MQWKRRLFCLLCFLFLGTRLSLPESKAEVVDRILAFVNDDIITLSELNEATKAFVTAREQNPFLREQDRSAESIRRNILENLINERLTDQEVTRLQISVREEEVDETIAAVMAENRVTREAMEAQLRKEGRTFEDLRKQVRKNLELNKLINREVRSKTVITDDLVEAYYQSNIEEFKGRERWRLQDIFLPFSSNEVSNERSRLHTLAEQILNRVNQGTDFGLLAQSYSRGPGAEHGGDLGYFSRGELDPVLEKAIENLQPGETSRVITTEMGLHILKVTEAERIETKSLDDVRDNIRNKLYQREINFKYREWLSSLRERSYVKTDY
jgi:peptidyl-prolyl cis-trans isomerase SurA